MDPVYDSSLDVHLRRIEAYMRGCGLLTVPRERGPLRSVLTSFLAAHLDRAVADWVRLVGPALGIPPSDWADLHRSMHDAMVRGCATSRTRTTSRRTSTSAATRIAPSFRSSRRRGFSAAR